MDVLEVYKKHLESGNSARSAAVSEEDKKFIADCFLLTAKPVLYVCNVSEGDVLKGNHYVDELTNAVKNENAEILIISANIEAEIARLENLADRIMFLKDLGLTEPGVNKLIKSAYKLLNLITYITAGEPEVRAWTIHRGTMAPAAGVIHTDFEKGFIRAEVIAYSDYHYIG